ncbi:MAG TPA: calcium-binding protein [Solirubrobacterales bacterium]|nr:calcium-binding protein [Solirubrobacterales bacterium]
MIAGAAALGLAPGTALAGSLDLDGGQLRYVASPGEANYVWNLHFDRGAETWEIGERAPFNPLDPECEVEAAINVATCPGDDGPLSASIALGDGNDNLQHMATWESINNGPVIFTPLDEPFALSVDGGPGDDEFWTSASGAPMSLLGGEGNDRFQFLPQDVAGTAGLPGRYLLDGGPGNDWLQVHGGGAVPVAGSTLTMEGGEGEDWALGSKGDDTIRGGPGHDRLFDIAGNDLMEGGDGNDVVAGGDGADFLSGGPGNDELQAGASGQERFDGGPGDDRIRAENSSPDQIRCGEGLDKIDFDPLADIVAADCERLFPSEPCKRWGATCTATVSILALAPGRPLLGRTKFEFRGVSMGGNRLPLSAKGRAYVQERGVVTVIRKTRISQPRKQGKKSRVLVRHTTLNLMP